MSDRKVVWAVLIRDHTNAETQGEQGELWAWHYATEDQALADIKEYVEERRKDAADMYEEDYSSLWESSDPREPNCQWRVEDEDGEPVFEFEIRSLQEAT